jgi:hypothetical protein
MCVDVCCPSYAQNVDECCASRITFSRPIDLCSSILCPKPLGDDWHKQTCLLGECSSCGIKTLKVYPIKIISCASKIMKFRQYEKVVVGQKDNGDD